MQDIKVEIDNRLKMSDIIIPLSNSSYSESGSDYAYNKEKIQQTKIYGINCPLIMINHIVIDFTDIISFTLNNENTLPSVSMSVIDRYNLIATIDRPNVNNELRIQIIPAFDNAYKKIDLIFYINNISISGKKISLNAIYKIKNLFNSRYEAYGMMNTYEFFKMISQNSKLGFSTNTQTNDIDKRYIYSDNKNYKMLMDREINYAGTPTSIFDYWVDWHNNITLVDIYKQFNKVYSDDDMMIWIRGQRGDLEVNNDITPMQVPATITDHPQMSDLELYVRDYKIVNSLGGNLIEGTDNVFSIYEDSAAECKDHLIQDNDGDEDNIVTNYTYAGEVYGDYNYMLMKHIRKTYMGKIASQLIEVHLTYPVFGIVRGNKVNFLHYINDDLHKYRIDSLKKEGILNKNIKTNININDDGIDIVNDTVGQFKLDKSVSGQYYVYKCVLTYKSGAWDYKLLLSRSSDVTPQMINKDKLK